MAGVYGVGWERTMVLAKGNGDENHTCQSIEWNRSFQKVIESFIELFASKGIRATEAKFVMS